MEEDEEGVGEDNKDKEDVEEVVEEAEAMGGSSSQAK